MEFCTAQSERRVCIHFLSRTTVCLTIIRITKVRREKRYKVGTTFKRPFPQCLYEKRGCWNCIINRFVQFVWSARGKKTHIVRRCFMESGNHMTRFYAKNQSLDKFIRTQEFIQFHKLPLCIVNMKTSLVFSSLENFKAEIANTKHF